MPVNKFKICFFLLLLGLCSVALTTGCSNKLYPLSGHKTLQMVRTVDPILALPHLVADHLKFFEENQLTIEEVNPDQGTPPSRGTIYLTDSPGIGKLEAPATILGQFARGNLVLFGRTSDDSFAWDHLQKRIVLVSKLNPWQSQQATLAFQNQQLHPNFDFILLNNIPDELMVNTFIYGTGDYLVTDLSTALELETKDQGQVLALMDNATGATLGAGYLATQQTLKTNRKELQAYVNAVYKGQLWINKHSNVEIANLVQSSFPLYAKDYLTNVIGQYRTRQIYTRTPFCLTSIAKIHDQIVQFDDHNLPNWNLTIDNSLARHAYRQVRLDPPPQKEK